MSFAVLNVQDYKTYVGTAKTAGGDTALFWVTLTTSTSPATGTMHALVQDATFISTYGSTYTLAFGDCSSDGKILTFILNSDSGGLPVIAQSIYKTKIGLWENPLTTFLGKFKLGSATSL